LFSEKQNDFFHPSRTDFVEKHKNWVVFNGFWVPDIPMLRAREKWWGLAGGAYKAQMVTHGPGSQIQPGQILQFDQFSSNSADLNEKLAKKLDSVVSDVFSSAKFVNPKRC
jgi:hypothetical protein